MANHKSAAKRARQSLRRARINQQTISAVRTFEKKLRAAIANKKVDEAKSLLRLFTSKIDKAAQKGRVHVNMAARKVARLSKAVDSLTK